MTSSERAVFVDRNQCLSCGSDSLDIVATGSYDDQPLAAYLAADPWGESPLPFLAGARWTLVRCRVCSLKFHRSILSPEWNERRFSKWMSAAAIKAFEDAERTESGFSRAVSFAEHVVRIQKLLESSHPRGQRRKVLDFGCGNGEFLGLCAAFGFDAHGVDRSHARRGNASHVVVHAEIADAAVHGPFDAITLFEVLEHLDDPAAILKSLRGLLNDNGILVLETPNCLGVDAIGSVGEYRAIHPLEHINAFEPATLQAFAERLGFRREQRDVVFLTADPKVAVRRLVRKALNPLTRAQTRLYFRKT